jgi:hypothetical protein
MTSHESAEPFRGERRSPGAHLHHAQGYDGRDAVLEGEHLFPVLGVQGCPYDPKHEVGQAHDAEKLDVGLHHARQVPYAHRTAVFNL